MFFSPSEQLMMVNTPSEPQILERVRQVVADICRIPIDSVLPDAKLGQELGMASLEYVDLQFLLETDFRVELYLGSAVERLAELLRPKELEKDGVLTQFGAAVLRLRLPEIDPERLREGEPAAGIEAMFTPNTWVRMLKELLDARPRDCPHCQSTNLDASKPSTLCCQACGREVTCPDGEACLISWAETVPRRLAEPQPLLGTK